MAVLALDAGGSSSRALLVEEAGAVLGAVRGQPAAAGLPPAVLDRALGALLGDLRAHVPAAPPSPAVVAGFAGAGRPEGARRAEEALRGALAAAGLRPSRLEITTDADIALRTVLPGKRLPVAVLIAGTGSIALAGVPGDAVARAGGWGPYLGDEGGGFWLGRRALEAVGRSADGRSPEAAALAAAVLGALGLGDADALALACRELWAEPRRVADLAPEVMRLAEAGDPAASAIADEAGRALAEVLLRARRAAAVAESAVTGLAGGLWAAGAPRRRSGMGPLRAALLRALPPDVAAGCRPLPVPQAVGAACSLLAPAAAAVLVAAAGPGSPLAELLG